MTNPLQPYPSSGGRGTPDEALERRKGWLTLVVVFATAIVVFAALWAVAVFVFPSSGGTQID